MSIYKGNDENIPTDTEAYYERVASQEEIYLEETEEELRAILIFDDPSLSQSSGGMLRENCEERELDLDVERSTNANNNPRCAESLDEQPDQAAEELITGDGDDPPLSEETVVEMIKPT